MEQHIISLNCRECAKNDTNDLERDGFTIRLQHREGEPENANRLVIEHGDFSVELLPSKGLSVGEAFYQECPIFWDPPVGLLDPDSLDPQSDEVWRDRRPALGMMFIKSYMGGIELLGLRNWGMPYTDENGKFHGVHGEVWNVPVGTITIMTAESGLVIEGSFLVRTFEGDEDLLWYQRGADLYEVTRTVRIMRDRPALHVRDRIKNISSELQRPDWGYHVTLRPEKGASYLIPSRSIEVRRGGEMPPDHEIWPPAENAPKRVEVGIIHKGMGVTPKIFGEEDGVRSLLRYPDGSGIAVSTTPAPYFQTWFSVGGLDTDEFTYADGSQVLQKNWDGQGIEFGSSPLDHDGNIDPSVVYDPILAPGQSICINILIEVLSPENAREMAENIEEYNKNRRL